MINILVVTHGEFGAYLVEAAEEIVGRQEKGVRCVGISPRLSVDEVRRRVAAAVKELSGGEGVLIAVDMPGGTPGNVAMPIARAEPKVALVGGVNLYMMVTAFNYRGESSFEAFVEKVLAAGRRSIVDMKAQFLARKA